ncbi:MAG: SAM-dependent methyltransferase [Syntrophomonadaceae bacterium]|jgi:cyclopropane fatty-acyl-phospholipid synthase-like methyltransferase
MYSFTNQFMSNDKTVEFLKATMMGPNAMRLAEELASHLNINENMRILDLGCGCGLSTLLLVKKYGASVFAADLWISPIINANQHVHSLLKGVGGSGLDSESQCSPAPV